MRRVLAALAAGTILAAIPAMPAAANIALPNACSQGWYVNDDEQALLPAQKPHGLLFDGPSLIHHAMPLIGLGDLATDGAFTATVTKGVPPLLKYETTGPYSTVNETGDHTWWSSKIATGPGSQASPVASPADLAELAPYTADTKVFSFGVGYANDTGNTALVKTIKFTKVTYSLACAASPSPSKSAATSAAAHPSTSTSARPTLPVTGFPTGPTLVIAVALLAAGGIGIVVGRRRRTRFEA